MVSSSISDNSGRLLLHNSSFIYRKQYPYLKVVIFEIFIYQIFIFKGGVNKAVWKISLNTISSEGMGGGERRLNFDRVIIGNTLILNRV